LLVFEGEDVVNCLFHLLLRPVGCKEIYYPKAILVL
jgi:hypothetical protein